jgi:hypothetical protein
MKFSNSINTIFFFFFFLALLGMATPSTATTTAAADIMATTAEPTESAAAAAGGSGGLRGGTAQEHRSLYCPYTTYIFCMSKCRSRLYKSITQCKLENPACAPSSCC